MRPNATERPTSVLDLSPPSMCIGENLQLNLEKEPVKEVTVVPRLLQCITEVYMVTCTWHSFRILTFYLSRDEISTCGDYIKVLSLFTDGYVKE